MWSSPRQLRVVWSAVLAALLLAAWGLPAAGGEALQAQSPGGGLGWQPCGSGIWSSYGQLSPEQQQTLQRISGEYSGRLYELKGLIFAKQTELHAHLSKDRIDTDAIDGLVAALSELHSEYLATRVEMIVTMRQNGLPFYGWREPGLWPGGGLRAPGVNRSRTW
jgi:zinc resistance-associated protein